MPSTFQRLHFHWEKLLRFPYHICTLHEEPFHIIKWKLQNYRTYFAYWFPLELFLNFSVLFITQNITKLSLPLFPSSYFSLRQIIFHFHTSVSVFSFFEGGGDKKTNDYHTLDVLFEILVPFTLKPVGKCLKGFHVSSVVLLSKLKQHGPCEIWVHPWVAIVH